MLSDAGPSYVCPKCYEKTLAYLQKYKHLLCHACMRPCFGADYVDLYWIGDEQVYCCGRESCKSKIAEIDKLALILQKMT